ncbi:MAG: leucine-rich repeat protein [Ruminococcus sp.]|nr:leucine-rich repeat protein [Ruminococcus sp.]
MKKHQKLISMVLSALMLTSAFSAVPAFAAELQAEQSVGGDLPASGSTANCKWTFNETTGLLTITGNGEMDLDENLTSENRKIKEVVICNGITSISPYAFYCCTSLKKVTIPYTVETIGKYAFEFCGLLETVETDQTGMNRLKSIGNGAFYGCESLKKFNTNQGLTSIGNNAFVNTGITGFMIPETVTAIGQNCFGYTYHDSTFYKVEDAVIYGVRGSAAEDYADSHGISFCGNTWDFNEITGVLTIHGNGKMELPGYWMSDYEYLDDVNRVILDDRITSVSNYTFYRSYYVDTFFLPADLTTIETYAFEFCGKLKSISLPKNTEYIGPGAFYGCTSLNKVTINEGLKSIARAAFVNTALTSVKIPKSVTYIGDYALGYTYQNKTYTKVDGFTIYGSRDSAAERYAEANGFNFVAQEYIQNVNVSFAEPAADETVSFAVYKDNYDCGFITSLFVQNGTGLEFNYKKNGSSTYMKPGDVFQAGTAYTATVWLSTSKENTFFDDELEVYFNGKKANVQKITSGIVCATLEYTAQEKYIPGDVNENGYVDIGDATMIQYHLADLLDAPLTEKQRKAADFDDDGEITIGDATMIQYYLADLFYG